MRLLAACPQCHLQFDVSQYAPRQKVACRCGGTLTVPQPRSAAIVVSRCSSCGGPRVADGKACKFCGSQFIEPLGMGRELVCPGCFICLPNDSKYCVECGLNISPQILDYAQQKLNCPRCVTALFVRHLQGPGSAIDLNECQACGGLWIPEKAFDGIVVTKESLGTVRLLAGMTPNQPARKRAPEAQVRYIPCPTCKNLMNRRNFGQVSGVIIDACKGHGVWLDEKELNSIIGFLEAGGMERARAMERERELAALREAKSRGAMPGAVMDLGEFKVRRTSVSGDILVEVVKGVLRLFIQ